MWKWPIWPCSDNWERTIPCRSHGWANSGGACCVPSISISRCLRARATRRLHWSTRRSCPLSTRSTTTTTVRSPRTTQCSWCYTRQMARGFTASANWTWSHDLGDGVTGSEYTGPVGIDYGNVPNDLRHRIAVTADYAIPFGSNLNGVEGFMAKGWKLNGVGYWQTGNPFTVYFPEGAGLGPASSMCPISIRTVPMSLHRPKCPIQVSASGSIPRLSLCNRRERRAMRESGRSSGLINAMSTSLCSRNSRSSKA